MPKLLRSSTLDTPADTYLYSIVRTPAALATIGSDDSLRLFDDDLAALFKQPACHTSVTSLSTLTPTTFATAGRDGTIKLWDSRDNLSAASLTLHEAQSRPFSALACHLNGFYIAAGTESASEGLGDVSVLVFDVRGPDTAPIRNYRESHTDSITQLAFHPTAENILMSGSTDGLVSLFDVNEAEEEDALQQVLNPRGAVHCSGFLTVDSAYVLTTDEHFSVHSLLENVEGSVTKFGDLRSKLAECQYVVGVMRQPDGQMVMAYGSTESRNLSLVQVGPDGTLGQVVKLDGAHGEEVVRDVVVGEGRAWSCGEDGRVRCWTW